jgi:uncharacterized protein with von Willebrand factor type A (vWA) domain
VLDRLLEFAALLRRNGVRVSPAETLEAVRAAEIVGLADAETLAAALRAALIKRAADEGVFDELFPLYFRRAGDFAGRFAGAPLVEDLRARGFTDEEIEAVLAMLADEAARLSATARMGLGLRRGDVEQLVRRAGVPVDFDRMVNPLQTGFFSQQVLEAMGMRQAEGELARLVEGLARKLPPQRVEALGAALRERLSQLRAAVRQYVADEFARRNVDAQRQARIDVLAEKPLGRMTDEELRRLRHEVERLARKLRAAATLRPRARRRGRLDARRTIRRSLASGGVPFVLKRRSKRIEKPRLVVLCDISDSVRNVSRFMLQFAYTLQDRFSKVRSFVFVSDVGETTQLFAESELHRAVDLAYAGAVINVYANSNYGRAFRAFRDRFLDAVTPKTTVIVIGDGRNNYQSPEAWALADVRARARRVLWLNPEPRLSWAFGDSAMRLYEPHCDRVEVVSNVASLRRVVDDLVTW